jgi:hypothetical protein
VTHSSSDQTIISLAKFREQAQQGALAQIEAYWEGLRNGRIMPSRSEVDPRAISGALEHAFVLERVARGVGRFRLAGMHLNDVLGMEVRGMPLTALILPESRDEMSAALTAVFDEPAIVRLTLVSDTGLGRSPMEARMILMPLRSDLGDVSRVLGCFVAEGKIGRAPRRFGVTSQSRKTLIGYGEGRPVAPVAPLGACPEARPDSAAVRRPVGRPTLTLVKSDD